MSCTLFTMTLCAPVSVDDAVFWILQVLGRVTDLFTADSGHEVEVEQVSVAALCCLHLDEAS